MTATFLRGDLDSPRFGERLLAPLRVDGVDCELVTRPDLGDAPANGHRRALLARQHEWLAGPRVFGDFPGDLDWSLVGLTPDDVPSSRSSCPTSSRSSPARRKRSSAGRCSEWGR